LKKLLHLLFSLTLLFLFVGQSFGKQIEVEGKKYCISEILSKTTLRQRDNKNFVISNPFDGKIVKMNFLLGWDWQYDKSLVDKFWPIAKLNFFVGIPENSKPFYELEVALIAPTKTKHGIIDFHLLSSEFNAEPGIPFSVLKTIVEAAEKQKKEEKLICIEMVGKLYLSSTIQKGVNSINKGRVHFIFSPYYAKIIKL
jgi:hypothetical protein